MKKKVMSLLLCAMLAAGSMTGCGGNSESSAPGAAGSGQAAEETQDIEKISMYIMQFGSASEYQNVVDRINEITTKEIGVEIDLTVMDLGQWSQQYSMLLTGGEEVDLMHFFADSFSSDVAQGAFAPLDDLVAEYGQDISSYVADQYMACGKMNGVQYGVPVVALYAADGGLVYNKDIADELNLDMENVNTLEDLEPVLAAVKEAHPEMIPLVSNAGNSLTTFGSEAYVNIDSLGDGYGVLDIDKNNTEVFNRFESDEYLQILKTMEHYYEEGYISTDVLTETNIFADMLKAGKAFACVRSFSIGYEEETTANTGVNVACKSLNGNQHYGTGNSVFSYFGIPALSKHKEAAMKFLNLAYKSSEIMTLLGFGEEGVNYQTLEDGTITFMDGEDPATASYHPEIIWALPNQYIAKVWSGFIPLEADAIAEYNASAKSSPAMGFTFDPNTVVNEVTAVRNVETQYRYALESGAVDIDTVYPEFIQALKDAGIDLIIPEKQAQLAAFLGN